MNFADYIRHFPAGGPLVLGAAYAAIGSALWLFVRSLRFAFGRRTQVLPSTLVLAFVHLLTLCAGVALLVQRVFDIAESSNLGQEIPIKSLHDVAGGISVFLAIGIVTAVACLLLAGMSMVTRRHLKSGR